MINTTNDNLDVTYVYTITANGCTNTQSVVVIVHPTPTLSSPLTASVCTGAPFIDSITSYVFGTSFAWSRAAVSGLTPAIRTGSGKITDTLTDSSQAPLVTQYVILLTANGCSHVQTMTLTVDPAPPALQITVHPSTNELVLEHKLPELRYISNTAC